MSGCLIKGGLLFAVAIARGGYRDWGNFIGSDFYVSTILITAIGHRKVETLATRAPNEFGHWASVI